MARVPGLYRRGNVWWCKYYVNGRPVRESTHTEKETEAKRILDGRRGRGDGTADAPSGRSRPVRRGRRGSPPALRSDGNAVLVSAAPGVTAQSRRRC